MGPGGGRVGCICLVRCRQGCRFGRMVSRLCRRDSACGPLGYLGVQALRVDQIVESFMLQLRRLHGHLSSTPHHSYSPCLQAYSPSSTYRKRFCAQKVPQFGNAKDPVKRVRNSQGRQQKAVRWCAYAQPGYLYRGDM
jgi:hypothetical protein